MALRETNTTVESPDNDKINTSLINRVFAWTGLIVGAVAIAFLIAK